MLEEAAATGGSLSREVVTRLYQQVAPAEQGAFNAALNWLGSEGRSVFLQDANSLIMKPEHLVEILNHLKKRFPYIDRITSYARSHTICRIEQTMLQEIREAGLDRLHIGLESGSDRVLKMVKKGVTQAQHIEAGVKAKEAGFELSEYVMPGLGGQKLSHEHATETAAALNKINPDFIRLRSLAVPSGLPLHDDYLSGKFIKCNDVMIARELLVFLEHLDGITSEIVSDHILNLFEEVTGHLPGDKDKMMAVVQRFLELEPSQQMLYQVGRRLSLFSRLDDMQDQERLAQVQNICDQNNITPENVENVIEEMMNRFI